MYICVCVCVRVCVLRDLYRHSRYTLNIHCILNIDYIENAYIAYISVPIYQSILGTPSIQTISRMPSKCMRVHQGETRNGCDDCLRGGRVEMCVFQICSDQGRKESVQILFSLDMNLLAREALNPEIHQIEKLRFLGISRCIFRLRFQGTLKWYRGI